ncbi:MAG TPA: hypothetical protein VM243_03910 [Phycisphaerae bacterium]|nr:hypothetical protein [Phycisphaerae bacterium]
MTKVLAACLLRLGVRLCALLPRFVVATGCCAGVAGCGIVDAGANHTDQAGGAFTISRQTFTDGLDDRLSAFEVEAGVGAVRQTITVTLYTESPADRPAWAELVLDADKVTVRPRPGGNARDISGSVTLSVSIAGAAAANAFQEGTAVGSLRMLLDEGHVSVEDPALRLPAGVLDHVMSGTFNAGLEVYSADVDAVVILERLGVTFGPAADDDLAVP